MEHIVILMIWTVVGATDAQNSLRKVYHDWRPIGEFHMEEGRANKKTAREMCEDAARQLGLKTDAYRCVRSK